MDLPESSDDRTITESRPHQPFAIPRVIGEYRVEQLLGRGGMGTVFRARREADDAVVALKWLHTQEGSEPASQKRFQREVRAIETLRHDHIVPLYETGEYQGRAFLTMKLIDGVTLADVCMTDDTVRQANDAEGMTAVHAPLQSKATSHSRPLVSDCVTQSFRNGDGDRSLAAMFADVAGALQAAHQERIVHRDVKPSNLLLDVDGKLWLTDFGLASLDIEQTALTRTGDVLGTPAYMSPEQAIGSHKAIDHRTDVYSLGVTLYELATRTKPFDGNRYEVLRNVTLGQWMRPSKRRPDIPKGLEAIIMKAMAQDPAQRYQTAADLAADLRRFAAGLPVAARIPGILDHAAHWLVAHPRRAVATATVALAAVTSVMSLQYLHGERLSDLNRQLEQKNVILADANDRLERSNAALDKSRDQLQHHLYVADMAAAYQAYAERDNDIAEQLLRRYVPGPDQVDRRRVEWWMLHHLTRSPRAMQIDGHDGAVREARYVPSRREIVSSGDDGTVRRWSAKDGVARGVHTIGGRLDALAVSPDGQFFVTGKNIPQGINRVAIRELDGGDVRRELTGHEYSVEAAAFSHDGRWVATAGRYQDILLHTTDGKLVARATTGARSETVAFTPDGRWLAAIRRLERDIEPNRLLSLWSVPELELQPPVDLPFDVSCLALGGDGQWAVAAGSDGLAIVHLASRKILTQRDVARGGIRCIAVSERADKIAIGCDNGLLYLWQFAPLQLSSLANESLPPPAVIATGPTKITNVNFIDRDTVLTSNEGGVVQAWDVAHLGNRVRQVELSALTVPEGLARSQKIYLRDKKGVITALDWRTLERQAYSNIKADAFAEFAVSPDGRMLVAAAPGELVVLELPSGKVTRRLRTEAPERVICDIKFLKDGKAWAVLFDDRLDVYDASDASLIQHLPLSQDGADELVVSPDGRILLVITLTKLLFFEADDRQMIAELPCTFGEFSRGSAFSNDGRLLAVGHQDGSVLLTAADPRRLADDEPVVLRGHRGRVSGCVFLDHDQTLATISHDATLRLWDVPSGRELGVVRLEKKSDDHLVYHAPTQQLLTAGPNGPTQIWPAGKFTSPASQNSD